MVTILQCVEVFYYAEGFRVVMTIAVYYIVSHLIHGDKPLIHHLVMREFVSGPLSYRSIHKKVCGGKPSLKESS